MSFKFNRFIFWRPTRYTPGCANLYSLISHRQCLNDCSSFFRNGLHFFTSESRVLAPVAHHGLDGPAREAGTKKIPSAPKVFGAEG